MSLFHDAARDGDVVLLRKASKRDVKREDGDGMTALHWVAWQGSVEAADVLLGKGADPNAADSAGNTPLHVAAQYGNVRLLRRLTEHGSANIWMLNDDEKTACDVAADSGKDNCYRFLDALQLRLQMESGSQAEKARQRAQKALNAKLTSRGKRSKMGGLRRATSTSALPSGTECDESEAETIVVDPVLLPRRRKISLADDLPNRGRAYSEPVDVDFDPLPDPEQFDLDPIRARPRRNSTSQTTVGTNNSKRESLPRRLKNRFFSETTLARSAPVTSAPSPASTVSRKGGGMRGHLFSLRPSHSIDAMTNSTSGFGSTDSSPSASMGTLSGTRTAQAIQRLQNLGGVNALTLNTTSAYRSKTAGSLSGARSMMSMQLGGRSSKGITKAVSAAALMSQKGAGGRDRLLAKRPSLSSKASAQGLAGHGLHRDDDDDGVGDMNEETPLAAFMVALQLDDHFSLLEEEDMDLDALMLCSDLDLKDLDIGLGPRRKILAAIQKRKSTMDKPGPLADTAV